MLDIGITRIILGGVKTAISILDPIFQAAEQLTKRKRISRSELYAQAVSAPISAHRHGDVTGLLNQVYGPEREESHVEPAILALQPRLLSKEAW